MAEREITVTINTEDYCVGQLAKEWLRDNPVEMIDEVGLEYLSRLLQENMMDMTDEELVMFDTCIRAEQHRRSKQ